MLSLRSGRYREEDARSQLLRIEAGAARVEVAHGALVAVERANTCAPGGSPGSAALAGESSHRRRAANSLRRTIVAGAVLVLAFYAVQGTLVAVLAGWVA